MNEDLERIVEEYLRHQSHVEMLQKMIAEYKDTLNTAVQKDGDEDDKGHQWLSVGKYLLQRQRRQGKKVLNTQRAEEWARERGIWDEVSKTVQVLDEDALLGYIYDYRNEDGLEDEFQSLFDTPPTSYAFMKPMEEQGYEY
jgi:hypothetical protein